MISVKNLSKHYGRKAVFKGVSISIPAGFTLMVGRNGAGKTTLLDLTYGLQTPSGGSISYLGTDVYSDPAAIRKAISYVPSKGGLPGGMKVSDLFDYISTSASTNTVEQYMDDFGIRYLYGKSTNDLSAGEYQSVKLTIALSMERECMLLDEPLTYVDREKRYQVVKAIKSSGRNVIWTTHEEDTILPGFDRIVRLTGESGNHGAGISVQQNLTRVVRFVCSDSELALRVLEDHGNDYSFANGEFTVYGDSESAMLELLPIIESFRRVLSDE